MRLMTTMMIAALWPISLGAQTFTPSTNPVSDTVREMLARDSKSLIASAELLPADKYGYRPTPAQMTFGQLFAHIVQTNIALCSALSDAASPMTGEELKKLAGTRSEGNDRRQGQAILRLLHGRDGEGHRHAPGR